ncbi:hypothetical protein [Flammeovirga aprica]|nr:hypothetical protein [Flammeovirga aprica]
MEKGRFELPSGFGKQQNIHLTSAQIMMLIEGISLEKMKPKSAFLVSFLL